MALPPDFYVPSRQGLIDAYERDVKIRQPDANVGPGTLPNFDAANIADHLLPVYADAVRAYHNTTLEDADEAGLEEKAVAKGLPRRLGASGASGFVQATIATGGVFIAAGKIIKDDRTNLQFQCTSGRTYGATADDVNVPVSGIDTGPSTNLAAGSSLRWENPPPGLAELATVVADTNGRGLTGGRLRESPDELRKRISDAEADPPAAGNSAEVRKLAKDAANALGIPMQEVFVYPAAQGPNTYVVAFMLRPSSSGGSRSPNAVQIAQVLAYITGALPNGDGIFMATVLDNAIDLMLRVKWATGSGGWKDLTRYPLYDAGSPAEVSAVTSATAFSVTSTDAPQVGQTIAFYDATTDPPHFVRKKILTVGGAGPYALTIDTTANSSDPTYLPIVGETFCPWADSLDLLVAPILLRFGELGPGEQFDDADLFDPGERLRRNPAPPVWPNELTHRVTNDLDDETAIADVSVLAPTFPLATPTGTPAVSSYLHTLGRLLAFP